MPLSLYTPNIQGPPPSSSSGGGAGSPEGVVVGTPYEPYLNTSDNSLWVKKTGVGTTTGWVQTTGGVSASGGLVARVVLTPGATVSVDASAGKIFQLTPGQNFTLANPTNPPSSSTDQVRIFEFIQPASGGPWLITLGSKYKIAPTGDITDVVLSTTANAHDLMTVLYNPTDDRYWVSGFVRGYLA